METGGTGRLAALHAALGHAKSTPLHVALHHVPVYRRYSFRKHSAPLLAPLIDRSTSWVGLELHGSEDIVHYFGMIRTSFPILRRLDLRGVYRHKRLDNVIFRTFSSAPSLRVVMLYSNVTVDKLLVPCASLTHFSGDINVDSQRSLSYLNLQPFCNLSVASFDSPWLPSLSSTAYLGPVTFARLTSLRVAFACILALIDAPKVTKLAMNASDKQQNEHLQGFIERTSGLSSLTLEGWDGDVTVMESLPSSISSLTVYFDSRNEWVAFPEVALFQVLTLRSAKSILPKLEFLELCLARVGPPCIQLQRMLDSRMPTDVPLPDQTATLKAATIHLSGSYAWAAEQLYRDLRFDKSCAVKLSCHAEVCRGRHSSADFFHTHF